MQNNFGPAMRSMRSDLGISQLDLAHAIGTTQRHVSFLETGRSVPTRDFVIRLAVGLTLSLPQRSALFEAAGFQNPYMQREIGSQAHKSVLDMLDRRVLAHWPYPAFVLDEMWNILRVNPIGVGLLGQFLEPENCAPSLFDVFLSARFQDRLENWEQVSLVFYFRMQAAAEQFPQLAQKLDAARAAGLFDHMSTTLRNLDDVPAYIPAILRNPDGSKLVMTSFVGRLASAHDATIAGLEIELMVPMDDATADLMHR